MADNSRGQAAKLRPDEIEATIVYSELGKAIFDHFQKISEFTPGLKPIYIAIMPDHLHFILQVERALEKPIGNAIGGFKTGCEKLYRKLALSGQGETAPKLFAEGFVDEIVLRRGQLAAEFNYLKDNPRRLAIKTLYPEFFKTRQRLWVNFRLASKEQTEGAGALTGGWFQAIGNPFLLERARLQQVQCSRRFFAYKRDEKKRLLRDEPPAIKTSEFDERLEAAISAAERGAVIVSPCISHGEREIARRVFEAGGRVITLQNKGFSPLYKPGGRLFESCADGRLLMLAPIAWPYQIAEKTMTRVDASILNRIAQLIVGEGAVEIDYKGVKVNAVERLAVEVLKGGQR